MLGRNVPSVHRAVHAHTTGLCTLGVARLESCNPRNVLLDVLPSERSSRLYPLAVQLPLPSY
jgi:hypothetical protein